ncbi:D-beta-hydroxybutyrate permease [Helicobacter heilmannii]|nr:D-beta-hydroxybutyrate permease [Helicobacter heilmannii]
MPGQPPNPKPHPHQILSIIHTLLDVIRPILIFSFGQYKFVPTINTKNGSIIALINTCVAVDFGSVVKTMPSLNTPTQHFLSSKFNPLISETITINILAGHGFSPSGGNPRFCLNRGNALC